MYLGIDLGTSGLKAILMSGTGDISHSVTEPLSVSRPKTLWSEQNPEDWWLALDSAMRSLGEQTDLTQIQAIGLSGQMHGATLLDADGQILRPAILWNDGRCASQCEQIEREVPKAREITGNIVMPGFTAPKLLWVKQNEPECFDKIAKVLLPKDYLRYRLSGDFAADMSDAAGTAWLNVETRTWDDALLNACGLTEAQMPTLFEGCQVTGMLSEELAESWGMKGVPIVAGAGDNAAGAIGVGLVESGQAMLSLGTSGVYFAVSDGFSSNPDSAVHSFCHALPNKWHLMSVVLSAANCLQWFADSIAKQPLTELLQQLEQTDIDEASTPYFLPYLSGERTPHNNPNAQGVFFGMTHETTNLHLLHAVMEGVSFAFKDGATALHQAAGVPNSITLIGGGSRSSYWRQLLSDVLDLPLECREGGEVGPALGAARLAMLSQKTELTLLDVCPVPPLKEIHQPNIQRNALFNKRYETFRKLYEQLQDLF
ncbi:MAG: xylulokinase [Alteromonadaceae bacterium]|nr:xylulokinase [Alteromonadaceae bacterium]